jgi:hypothetical protein
VGEVREQRLQMPFCPSAQPDVDVNLLLEKIVEEEAYQSDYVGITVYFQNKPLDYDTAIGVIQKIIESRVF